MRLKTVDVAADVVATLTKYGGLYNRQISRHTGYTEQATHAALRHLLRKKRVKRHRRGCMIDYYLVQTPVQ